MEIIINTELCQGYGQCALTAPQVFGVDPEGKSRLLDATSDSAESTEVKEAAEVADRLHRTGAITKWSTSAELRAGGRRGPSSERP